MYERICFAQIGKVTERTFEQLPEFTTSRWCLSRPIARTGFTIRGLEGGKEYTDIRVRAKNAVGTCINKLSCNMCSYCPQFAPFLCFCPRIRPH
jgi:hypothetical protein